MKTKKKLKKGILNVEKGKHNPTLLELLLIAFVQPTLFIDFINCIATTFCLTILFFFSSNEHPLDKYFD